MAKSAARKSKIAKTPKAPNGPRKNPKTRPDAPGAERGIGDNGGGSRLTAMEERQLFLRHRTAWNAYQAKLKVVEKLGIDVKAALKADGFQVKHMKIADDLGNVKGEKRIVDDVTERLRVARWIGHAIGRQLDLFEKAQRRQPPMLDAAYDRGLQASMENQPRKPPEEYPPGGDAYDRWLDGYADHQEELAAGFKRAAGDEQKTTSEQMSETVQAGDEAIKQAEAAIADEASKHTLAP